MPGQSRNPLGVWGRCGAVGPTLTWPAGQKTALGVGFPVPSSLGQAQAPPEQGHSVLSREVPQHPGGSRPTGATGGVGAPLRCLWTHLVSYNRARLGAEGAVGASGRFKTCLLPLAINKEAAAPDQIHVGMQPFLCSQMPFIGRHSLQE